MTSIWLSLTSPAWLPIWFSVEFWSILGVVVFCGLEAWAEHHKFSDRFKRSKTSNRLEKKVTAEEVKTRYKAMFAWLLVISLAVELLAFGLSYISSNREIEAWRFKIKPRQITLKQEAAFIKLCENMPKIPIKVLVDAADNETKSFAADVIKTLNDAGFTNVTKIDLPGFSLTRPIGQTNDFTESELLLVKKTPDPIIDNNIQQVVPEMVPAQLIDNVDGKPTVIKTFLMPSSIGIVNSLGGHFREIGISTVWMATNFEYEVRVDEAAILVPQKFH